MAPARPRAWPASGASGTRRRGAGQPPAGYPAAPAPAPAQWNGNTAAAMAQQQPRMPMRPPYGKDCKLYPPGKVGV